jgi:D-alanyl-D-alanine carboxypeptidase
MNRIYLSKRSEYLYWIKDCLDNKRLGEVKIINDKTTALIKDKYQHQNINTEAKLILASGDSGWKHYCHDFIEFYNVDFLDIELDDYNFPRFAEACRLHSCGKDLFNREAFLHPRVKLAWNKMQKIAKIDGVDIQIISAYRSMDYQKELIQVKLDKGETIENILKVNTLPGYSEHHTGCAIDIGSKGEPVLEESFEQTTAFKWLQNNAQDFGFSMSYPKGNNTGLCYEPWHWCFKPEKTVLP